VPVVIVIIDIHGYQECLEKVFLILAVVDVAVSEKQQAGNTLKNLLKPDAQNTTSLQNTAIKKYFFKAGSTGLMHFKTN